MDYAVIRTGGKQYRVSPGDVIDVERLPEWGGASVDLEDVLAVSRDGQVTIGTPKVDGVRVQAEIQEQIKDDKVVVFKYQRKTRYRRKRGHRQPLTRLLIKGIQAEGDEQEEKPDGTQKSRRKQPQRTRQQRQTARRKKV